MSENRLPDYLEHIQQAAADACGFVEGMSKDDFLEDKRTQQAVVMSLIIIGEASWMLTPGLPTPIRKYPGATCVACTTGSPTAISISTSKWSGRP